MDSNKQFNKKQAEGYLSLVAGALFFTGAVGLFFYFISGCRPSDVPQGYHSVIEEVSETVIETALGLEEGTIEINLDPGDDPCKEPE